MSRFEIITNTVVLAAALVVGGVTIYDRFRPASSTKAAALAAPLVGKRLPIAGDPGSRQTVTLFVASTCRFCTSSMGFYRQLAALRRNASCDFRLLAMGPDGVETKETIREYLSKNNLSVDERNVMDYVALTIPATPTLVIQDSRNIVRNAWVGSLGQEAQDDVVSKIKTSCSA